MTSYISKKANNYPNILFFNLYIQSPISALTPWCICSPSPPQTHCLAALSILSFPRALQGSIPWPHIFHLLNSLVHPSRASRMTILNLKSDHGRHIKKYLQLQDKAQVLILKASSPTLKFNQGSQNMSVSSQMSPPLCLCLCLQYLLVQQKAQSMCALWHVKKLIQNGSKTKCKS